MTTKSHRVLWLCNLSVYWFGGDCDFAFSCLYVCLFGLFVCLFPFTGWVRGRLFVCGFTVMRLVVCDLTVKRLVVCHLTEKGLVVCDLTVKRLVVL